MMEKQFFGQTTKDLKQIAYQLYIRYKFSHPFSQGKQSAGKNWMKHFMKRHPELTITTEAAGSVSSKSEGL
jgi:hypothetical protein